MKNIIKNYDPSNITIAVLGSHSALDVCSGAKKLGFKTLVIAEKGRDTVYSKYYKTDGKIGCVDNCLILDKFSDLLKPEIQTQLIQQNTIFVPHRSFQVYLNFDYRAIENEFQVPMFGNKFLLKSEERGVTPNQYDILKAANIRFPIQFTDPKDIDRLCLVKVLEKARGFERAFFVVDSYQDFKNQTDKLLKDGTFTEEQLQKAVIEEFVTGVHTNFNYFYSPISKKLELMGTDTRRQTNLEGISRIPISYQTEVLKKLEIKYEEAGHIAVTVLESMLEKIFAIGENFVTACQNLYSPGVVGPFALQSIIVPGPPQKDIIVIDVSPRMPGSPGLFATPYNFYLYGKHLSVGTRVAMEIKSAIETNSLDQIVT